MCDPSVQVGAVKRQTHTVFLNKKEKESVKEGEREREKSETVRRSGYVLSSFSCLSFSLFQSTPPCISCNCSIGSTPRCDILVLCCPANVFLISLFSCVCVSPFILFVWRTTMAEKSKTFVRRPIRIKEATPFYFAGRREPDNNRLSIYIDFDLPELILLLLLFSSLL